MNNRRQHVRIDSSFKLSYKVISPPDGLGDSATMNISEGGISVPIDKPLLPGVVLELVITLVDPDKPIRATAEVVWVKEMKDDGYPFLVGLKFLHILTRDRERIYYHIHKKTEQDSSGTISWID